MCLGDLTADTKSTRSDLHSPTARASPKSRARTYQYRGDDPPLAPVSPVRRHRRSAAALETLVRIFVMHGWG